MTPRYISLHRLVLVLVLALCGTGLAQASSFSVNPTQVFLSASTTSSLVTIRNESEEPIRFQVSAFTWNQTLQGEMQLTPTKDVIFFPAMLTLEPKEERKIRVGAVTAAGAVEKTYRLFVEELPPPEKQGQNGVRVLTRMGIPIFLQPASQTARATVKNLQMRGAAFAFRLASAGTVHFRPQSIRVRALDGAGAVIQEQKIDGWYILAATEREYEVTVPKPDCSRVASFVVEVQLEKTALIERLQVPTGACGS